MIIKSLSEMEKIVKANRQLSWNGWDVVKRTPHSSAATFPNAVYVKGRWYLQKVFPVTENGWDIPGKLLG